MKQWAALLLVAILAISTGTVLSGTTPTPMTTTSGSTTPLPPTRTTPPPPPTGTNPPPPPTGSTPPPPPTGTTPRAPPTGSTPSPPPPPPALNKTQSPTEITPPLLWKMDTLMNPQATLLQEIRSLDEESTDEEIQKVLVKATKANNKKTKVTPLPELAEELESSVLVKSKSDYEKPLAKENLKAGNSFSELIEDEDFKYELDDPDWDDEDDDDDDDDEDDLDDDIDDEEEILFEQNCPSGCKCSEQYSGSVTARCTEFSSAQTFGPDMAHLKIENAGDLELGPHSLREKGLHQMQSLSIVDTAILKADKTAFDGIPDLFAVNLTRNELLDIDPDTFQNNSQLNLLTISGNPLQFSQGKSSSHAKYFLDAPTVSELDLSNNALTRLWPTTFAKMPRLVYISLKNNKLRAVDKALFKSLDQLEELDLSHNQLNGIPADAFDANEYLETLHISGNNLTTLATIKATRLNSLDASKNRIKIVAKDDLVGIVELERLYLRSNGLKRIHPHAFSDLVELTYLDISDNKMTTLDEHHLRSNSRLQTIIMNDNPGLETLPVFKTEDTTFSTTHFECADCGLLMVQAGTFDAMPAMVRLNLARNRLSSFPKGFFKSFLSLKDLDLSDNLFSSFEIDVFQGATTLTSLNLAGNPLISIQASTFLLTPSLQRLDLSRCALSEIWNGTIVPLGHLKFLSVRGNRIERITVEELNATPKLSSFDISNNYLECDQHFNAVIQWLIDHGVSPTETIRYINNYREIDDYTESENESLEKWTDLAKVVCDSIEDEGLLPRMPQARPNTQKGVIPTPITDLDELAKPFDHGRSDKHEEIEDDWTDPDYEEYSVMSANYRPWYAGTLWPVMTVILVTLAVVLFVANLAVYLSKRRGRGPVIRAPMMLRPGLIDNKNCGLVYKPLQEEIPTPQMAKRGSFYSSSTFHYDKIVPESV